jgi:hypothetical protein
MGFREVGCNRQSPISVRHVSRLTERCPKWDRKHCLMHGEWPPAATLHASGTSLPPPRLPGDALIELDLRCVLG